MKLKFEQPLRHRPGVLVHRKPDGSSVIIGDGDGFTSAEFMQLSPLIEQPAHVLPFTVQERADLDRAETRLAEALRLSGRAKEAMFEALDRAKRFERGLGLSVSSHEANRVVEFKAAHDAAVATVRDASEAVHDARVAQTHTQHRVHRVAQQRQRAVEDAKTPPPNPRLTLAERMSELAGRLP